MKLAEAIIHRKEVEISIGRLKARIERNLIVQDGVAPQEDAKALIQELRGQIRELTACTQRIQRTNAANYLLDDKDQPTDVTLQEALLKRDGLIKEQDILRSLAINAVPNTRYSNSEIRMIPMVDSTPLIKAADKLAQEVRNLNLAIQKTNWLTEMK